MELKNDFVKFGNKHEFKFGGRIERYHSDNVFFNCCKQGAWVYNSLDDFYADARDALANPNRTTSPIRLAIPESLHEPGRPRQAVAAADRALRRCLRGRQLAPEANLTIMMGLRFDVPVFENTAYLNPNANALTFRDESGAAVQYDSGQMPGANILWSPRAGFNYDLAGDQKTQLRGGTGVFTGQPLYVWISNQLGNTGMLQGTVGPVTNTTAFPFSTNVEKYKPAASGQPAASYELNVTDNEFQFPQVWRSNIAVDRRLPGGFTGTAEFIYNRDVNGMYYINANLPAAQSAYTGVDKRARWVGTACSAPAMPVVA